MAATTDILLATYNGGAYLGAQLDSLLAQTEGDFTLRVRDDGFSDDTAEVLRAYAPRFGDRFVLLPTDRPTGSAKSNFAKLMEASTADHLLFADHDDVWTPDHVAEIRRLLRTPEIIARTARRRGTAPGAPRARSPTGCMGATPRGRWPLTRGSTPRWAARRPRCAGG